MVVETESLKKRLEETELGARSQVAEISTEKEASEKAFAENAAAMSAEMTAMAMRLEKCEKFEIRAVEEEARIASEKADSERIATQLQVELQERDAAMKVGGDRLQQEIENFFAAAQKANAAKLAS